MSQGVKDWGLRDCFEQLEEYLYSKESDRVCLIFGLRRTGKTTMLRQAIGRMAKENLSRTAYIKARRTDNMAMMNRDLKKLFNAGFRYVFIDEVTLMEDFIDSAALFSDVFATMGMKIVLSGTDSLGFWLAMDEELYDRAKSIHTTFIPYREYSRLLGIDSIDEYIRYGGTLRAGELAFDDEDVNAQDASFRDDKSTRRYIDTAICKNIQHSLACYESGGHFRHLYSLYEAGELTSAINRIIEDMNHRFLISVLTDDFLSHDLRLTAANLRKERDPEKRTEALDAIDTEAVTRRLMELLDIRNKEEQSIGTAGQSLLSGNIFCGHCGGRLVLTTNGTTTRLADGTPVHKKRIRYVCYNKTRRRQECTGQTGYTMHILDGIVTEVLHQVFDKMQGASNDMIVGSAVQKQMAMIRSELQRARAENTKANKEYESLKAEVLKAIQGKSALPQDVLTEMLEDTRQKVLSTSERITTLTAELNDGNSKIEEMKAEFNRIVSWSKIFDESPMEVKKMICGYIIKKVSVFRDYRIKIEFNINVEQFLNGIDSIDECDTYELPMAQ
ncbi:MAG: AAA family ATPase [Flavonifractor plautii]